MADTIQVVNWTLAQQCALRNTEESRIDPAAAFAAVREADIYGRYRDKPLENFGFVGGVCVLSYSSARLPLRLKSKHAPPYPYDGIDFTHLFDSLGGKRGLETMCDACPANTCSGRPAGCVGSLYRDPDSEQTQAQLHRAIDRIGLIQAINEHFPPMTRTWYAFWARSPVQISALGLLRKIIAELHRQSLEDSASSGEFRADDREELASFVRAATIAEQRGIALHVAITPPGHTDFGWYTVFAHCPYCKAAANLPRWKRKQPLRLYTCQVCGTQFSPAETASSERDERGPDLRELIGPERFRAIAKDYLMRHGQSAANAEEIVTFNEAEAKHRRQEAALARHRQTREDHYVQQVLLKDLHPLYPDRDTEALAPPDESANSDESESDRTPYLEPAEFEEFLRRCRSSGVNVTWMIHRAPVDSDQVDQFTSSVSHDAEKIFRQWRAKGYTGHFGAGVHVPDALLVPES